jgi:hypothetical protein
MRKSDEDLLVSRRLGPLANFAKDLPASEHPPRMGRWSSGLSVVKGRLFWGIVVAGALTGCPGAADLEDVDRFEIMKDPPAPTTCDQPLPETLPSGCDYGAVLRNYCALSGCHGSNAGGGLDLRPDTLLIARVLDVPALHRISCGATACDPEVPTCSDCDACPDDARLVDSRNPAESWLLKKLAPFEPGTTTANVAMNCGDAMPSFYTPRDVLSYSAADKACLTEFFTYLVTSTPHPERFPCPLVVDGGT